MKKYYPGTIHPHRFGRWEFRLQADGSICVTNFFGNRDVLEIPAILMGRPVTALGRGFCGPSSMQLLILPDTLRSIGPYTCNIEENLLGVVIPPSVTHIADSAFEDQHEDEDFLLFVQEGSYAHAFAEEHGFNYELGTAPELEASEESFISGPWLYGLVDDEAVVREYNGMDPVVEMPAEIDGYPVTGVSSNAFYGNDFIEELTIPEGVRYIHACALAECDSLRRVHLPDSLYRLFSACFARCRHLEAIDLPPDLENIPSACFTGCESLRRIALPAGIRIIEMLAFSGCTALEKISLSPVLETVFSSTFRNCPNLRRPWLPDTLDEESYAILAALPEA